MARAKLPAESLSRRSYTTKRECSDSHQTTPRTADHDGNSHCLHLNWVGLWVNHLQLRCGLDQRGGGLGMWRLGADAKDLGTRLRYVTSGKCTGV